MGWTFQRGASKSDIIQDLVKPDVNQLGTTWRTLAHCVRGNVLWAVQERTHADGTSERFILCALLEHNKEYGWGYKDMSDSMGPCEVSCPLSYLDLSPKCEGYSEEWRKRVLAHHAHAARTLAVGATYALPNCKPDRITITSLKPLRGEVGGRIYRVSKKQVGERIEQLTTN